LRYELEPEVAGGLGANTVADSSFHPPLVEKLHYEFSGWLGDDLLESFPCYIVTTALASKIQNTNLTGIVLETVEISKSEVFLQLYPSIILPSFKWLKIIGSEKEDFTINENGILSISNKAFSVLKQTSLNNCDINQVT